VFNNLLIGITPGVIQGTLLSQPSNGLQEEDSNNYITEEDSINIIIEED